jgi:hypothetical protein
MEDDAGRRMRRLRAQVDTGNREPSELPIQEVSLHVVE